MSWPAKPSIAARDSHKLVVMNSAGSQSTRQSGHAPPRVPSLIAGFPDSTGMLIISMTFLEEFEAHSWRGRGRDAGGLVMSCGGIRPFVLGGRGGPLPVRETRLLAPPRGSPR